MRLKIFSLICFFPGFALATTISNTIEGLGPKGSLKPWICLPEIHQNIAPGGSVDIGQRDYAGAELRFNGCDKSDSYLGWMDISLKNGQNRISKYIPPEGVHVRYVDPRIDNQGHIGGAISYTAIASNETLSQAQTPEHWEFAGINLSGLEFGKVIDPAVVPNLSLEDQTSPYSDLENTQTFIEAGMNTVRLPLSWGYLQLEGPGKGAVNMGYYRNYIQPLLQTLTKAKVHTLLDLHAYMRYSRFGEEYSGCFENAACPDGTLILDEQAYQSVWSQLLRLVQEDPEIDKDYILVDLVNEPVDVPEDKVFTIQVSLIKTLRKQGFNGFILLEGNNWTGLHSWTTQAWGGPDGKRYTNAELFSRENFAKAGITDLSRIMINVHQYLDQDYSGTHDNCLQDLSTSGPEGFNLDAFTDYLKKNQLKAMVTEFGAGADAASCSAPLNNFLDYMKTHAARDKSYGFAGWTIWSSGHGWGDYKLRVKPDSWHMQVLKAFL